MKKILAYVLEIAILSAGLVSEIMYAPAGGVTGFVKVAQTYRTVNS